MCGEKSAQGCRSVLRTRDHPRACGEKNLRCRRNSFLVGSPPRMRGKESGCVPGLPGSRITPAYAGKRTTYVKHLQFSRNHPRVCGEKDRTIAVQNQPQGSPPRVRGKVTRLYALADKEGITPAYAGKSLRGMIRFHHEWDHPRMCGEKTHDLLTVHLQEGSPPRVRGKASLFHALGNNHRITPACAGKSVRRENSSS